MPFPAGLGSLLESPELWDAYRPAAPRNAPPRIARAARWLAAIREGACFDARLVGSRADRHGRLNRRRERSPTKTYLDFRDKLLVIPGGLTSSLSANPEP
jgi:hypothetical protein